MNEQPAALDLALHYQSLGIPIFPCRPADEDSFDPSTGEITTRPEKSPLTHDGLKGATKNDHIIRTWFGERYPNALIGVPTGEKLGAWVLDVDVKHLPDGTIVNGFETLRALEEIHGELPVTAMVSTANGGRHYFWKHVEGVRNRGGLGAALDCRGDGGYVIGPGSVMADGRSYEWVDHDGEGLPEFANAPEWLLSLVLPKPFEKSSAEWSGRLVAAGDNPAWVAAAVNDELEMLARKQAPGRGELVNRTAFKLGQFIAGGALDRGQAEADLYSAAVANGVLAKDGEKEIRAKIRRGIEAGLRLPRQVPERSADSNLPNPVGVARLVANHAAKQRAEEPLSENGAQTLDSIHKTEISDATPEKRILVASPFVYRDPSLIPRREFLYGRHYVRKYLTATFGAGGGGKSALAVSEALSMCTGRPLLGGAPQAPLRVWYINAEDDPVEIERRFAGAIKHYNIRPDQIGERLFTDSGRQQSFVVMTEDGKKTRVCVPTVDAFKEEVRRNRIDVAIVDPFVSTHEVEENDNSKIQRVATQWVLIAEQAGCAIELIHHVTKNNMEITADSGRGAGALKDKCRSVRTINQMTDAEATEAAVPQHDRMGYFRVDFGKANLAKRTGKSDWRRFQSVKLGNGKGNLAFINGDEIGVVVPWDWPSSEKIAEGLSPEQLRSLKVTLDSGSYKAAPNSREWAGLAVAYVMGADASDKANRKQAGAILKALLKEGVLEQVNEKDPVTRMSATFVRSAADVADAA
ncbi:ATPase [Mesorhizobium sp. M2D.F.Ca.ET.225.01.1.1]|uniref:AAA family ATPase n=1 Tax=unclassified Mesorhizobium TaxID=325217 RepID=UPI000FD2BCCF|nr:MULTISPECIES: AAA family ATPase [unclassified Mesorhizobium]TGP65432.1 ATPase [Mesorhizobium sp. M2D.F.Ca.ET.226.01.1.1]TGP71911.1 ATPase [Mesorhizobium sp. M2D.F.Ca.ET.225.01.1.1]